jgi:mitogen-activated protein kinase 1/3
VSTNDQLNVIFDIIGTPSEEDTSFVTDTKAQEYLKSFPVRGRADLKTIYPGIGEEAIDLLNQMLVFNPFFRPSVEECLDHPYFKQVRVPLKELEAEKEVFLDFEKESDLSIESLR